MSVVLKVFKVIQSRDTGSAEYVPVGRRNVAYASYISCCNSEK